MKKIAIPISISDRTRDILLILAIIAAAVIPAACTHKDKDTTEGRVPDIDVALATEDSITVHKTFPGIVAAGTKADVVGRVSGRLLSKNYKDGQYVNKGQVLFTIESTSYRDAVERAEADLQTARSQYAYAKSNNAAMKKALEADAVSKMSVMESENNERQAAASIKEAEAALSTARLNLGYCTVTAPISGYISSPTMDVGNYVNGAGSAVTLASIYDNAKMVAIFSLSDDQYEALVGANGGIGGSLYRNVPLKFREPMELSYSTDLTYEAPTVNRATGTMELKGSLQNPKNELKDGMYVTVSLPYGTRPHAVLVSDASIGSDQLGKYMYLVNDSDKVVYTPVTVGELYQDTLRVIEKGVKPGDRYVTKAMLTVRTGERIHPVVRK